MILAKAHDVIMDDTYNDEFVHTGVFRILSSGSSHEITDNLPQLI